MSKRQNEGVVVVHFYKSSDGKSSEFSTEFEKQAEKMKGIISFNAVNCDREDRLCAKEGVTTEFPTIKIYPPIPIPAFVPDVRNIYLKNLGRP